MAIVWTLWLCLPYTPSYTPHGDVDTFIDTLWYMHCVARFEVGAFPSKQRKQTPAWSIDAKREGKEGESTVQDAGERRKKEKKGRRSGQPNILSTVGAVSLSKLSGSNAFSSSSSSS